MPLYSADDIARIFDAMGLAMKIAKSVRDANPARKNHENKDVCRFCDGEIIDDRGQPFIQHTADCPHAKAQELRG